LLPQDNGNNDPLPGHPGRLQDTVLKDAAPAPHSRAFLPAPADIRRTHLKAQGDEQEKPVLHEIVQ
jgi:hypothetical protein